MVELAFVVDFFCSQKHLNTIVIRLSSIQNIAQIERVVQCKECPERYQFLIESKSQNPKEASDYIRLFGYLHTARTKLPLFANINLKKI